MKTKTETRTVYVCSGCNGVYLTKESADRCCTCMQCGKDMPGNRMAYSFVGRYKRCDECIDEANQKWREKYVKQDSEDDYYGYLMVALGGCDNWLFGDLDEIIEEAYSQNETVIPTINGTLCVDVGLEADTILESLNDDLPDNCQICDAGRAALEKMCDDWNKEFRKTSYVQDLKTEIIPNQDHLDTIKCLGMTWQG